MISRRFNLQRRPDEAGVWNSPYQYDRVINGLTHSFFVEYVTNDRPRYKVTVYTVTVMGRQKRREFRIDEPPSFGHIYYQVMRGAEGKL